MPFVSLRDLTWETFDECCELEVSEAQEEFIYSNVYSIAESRFVPSMRPQAIYVDELMVGFVLYGLDPEEQTPWIWRFMISADHQRRGHGTAALQQVVHAIRQLPGQAELFTSFTSNNEAAKRLFSAAGFHQTDEEVDDEPVWSLRL